MTSAFRAEPARQMRIRICENIGRPARRQAVDFSRFSPAIGPAQVQIFETRVAPGRPKATICRFAAPKGASNAPPWRFSHLRYTTPSPRGYGLGGPVRRRSSRAPPWCQRLFLSLPRLRWGAAPFWRAVRDTRKGVPVPSSGPPTRTVCHPSLAGRLAGSNLSRRSHDHG